MSVCRVINGMHSSVVEHPDADRCVPGLNPDAPIHIRRCSGLSFVYCNVVMNYCLYRID
jgi:hypothetical protein